MRDVRFRIRPNGSRRQAILPARLRANFNHDFGRQAQMMKVFVKLFGPYPLASGYTVVVTDDDFLATPAAREFRRQFTTDALMQIEEKMLVERVIVERTLTDRVLGLLNTTRQMWREFGIAQDAERGVDVACCCVRRLSSASSIA